MFFREVKIGQYFWDEADNYCKKVTVTEAIYVDDGDDTRYPVNQYEKVELDEDGQE